MHSLTQYWIIIQCFCNSDRLEARNVTSVLSEAPRGGAPTYQTQETSAVHFLTINDISLYHL